MATQPRIILLHATEVAVEPVVSAFRSAWPDAERVNLLDDALSLDRQRDKDLTEAMVERFVAFGTYGYKLGAAGILVTCSAFGPAIDRLADSVPVPVLKPNEAMFENALAVGRNIGMLATFGPSVQTMTDEFEEYVGRKELSATLKTVLVADAMDQLRKGDAETHNRLVAERAPELANCDAIMLAHFSTSRALEAVRGRVSKPVLVAPLSAVERMRSLVLG